MCIVYYLIIVNVIGFLLCFIDKRLAVKHKYRISESVLLFISLIGGCLGLLISMYMFHHKTKKLKFKLVYVFIVIWIVILLKI